LLLRTPPAIDADFENGITDPTAPKKDEAEAASFLTNEEEAGTTAANHEGTPAWVPSIPEPDLTKRPS
jgi:hypothetical protein